MDHGSHSAGSAFQPTPPIVLTWPEPLTDVPFGNPPAYDHARLPLHAVNYTFSPQGFNTTLLLPPSDLPETRPQYHISVVINVMNPFSFITTIHRGASESGPYVAQFEMGISTNPSTVCMEDCQKKIKDAIRSEHRSRWVWHFRDDPSQHIRWELNNLSTGLFNCFFASDSYPASTQLKIAQFKGVPLEQKGTARTAPSMLRIYPAGQALFDDILVSAMILERRRLRPPRPQVANNDPDGGWWS
ncbi:hypothetical protein C8R43DRAFT_1046167 [Mycena crocata]|nr:hypothetical protein C8R43DRAFT_1046167 [Mycena crocata]